jgi:hypothetical protein
MEVLGYTYEAGIHCRYCAKARFNNLSEMVRDREGNEVMPIFTTDDMSLCGEMCEDCGDWVSEPVTHDPGTCGNADSCRLLWVNI